MRLYEEPTEEWQRAYAQAGRGSTKVRSYIISQDVFTRRVTGSRQTSMMDDESLLSAVRDSIRAATDEVGARLT